MKRNKAITGVLFLLWAVALLGSCSPKITEIKTEYRDTVITLQGDTVINWITLKELCDTVRDTVIITKQGRLQTKFIVKNDTVRFVCNEDSLRLVIQKATTTKVQVIKEPAKWQPFHFILLLFAIALILFALNKLLK